MSIMRCKQCEVTVDTDKEDYMFHLEICMDCHNENKEKEKKK